jgi:hypothetical protein
MNSDEAADAASEQPNSLVRDLVTTHMGAECGSSPDGDTVTCTE